MPPEIKSKKTGRTFNPDSLYEAVKAHPNFQGMSREDVWAKAQSDPQFEVSATPEAPATQQPAPTQTAPPPVQEKDSRLMTLGKNFLPSFGNAVMGLAKTGKDAALGLISAGPQAVELGKDIYENGFLPTVKDRAGKVYDAGVAVAKDYSDMYLQGTDKTLDNMAKDPFRVLMDASSVAGGVSGLARGGSRVAAARGATGTADALSAIANRSMKASNLLDPVTDALNVGKYALRSMGLPEYLYGKNIKKYAKPELDQADVDRLTKAAVDRGTTFTGRGMKELSAGKESKMAKRGAMTDILTQDIPSPETRGIASKAARKVKEGIGEGGLLEGRGEADSVANQFLSGTDEYGRIEGRRRHPTEKVNPLDPSSPSLRVLNGKELHTVVTKQNRQLDDFYKNAARSDPKTAIADKAKYKTMAEINNNALDYIESQLPPDSGFRELGRSIRDDIQLEKIGSNAMGKSRHSAGDVGFATSGSKFGKGYLIDKVMSNPGVETKVAASVLNKSRGPVAKGVRAARRIDSALSPHDIQDKDQPAYQRFPEGDQQEIPGAAVQSGQYNWKRF